MTIAPSTRNPAAAILESLARCEKIRPFQAGDEDLLCSNDMLPLVSTKDGWRHDPAVINRLRNATYDDRWPSRG